MFRYLFRPIRRYFTICDFEDTDMRPMSVGVQSDGNVTVDIFDNDEEGRWLFHELTIEEAEFLAEELNCAISRQKARGFGRPTISLPTPTINSTPNDGYDDGREKD